MNTVDWKVEHVVLYDHETRAVFQMFNDRTGVVMSYILSNDETFDYTKESCKNDVLGPLLQGPLKAATIKGKSNATSTLANGQTLDIGSYLVVKNEGTTLNQENVFGFIAQNHTCAEIHLSKTPFKSGEESVFDPLLNAFIYDPTYVPTKADYAVMAKLLPQKMAEAYEGGLGATTPSVESKLPGNSQPITFAFPNHPGYLKIDDPNFTITELSAKSGGGEFGIRAQNNTAGITALGFLYLPKTKSRLTSATCMQQQLESELKAIQDQANYRKFVGKRVVRNSAGFDVAIAEYAPTQKKPNPFGYTERLFIADSDLCADISLDSTSPISNTALDSLLNRIVFDPNRPPDFNAKFRYAQVLFDHQNPLAAAPIYESSIELATQTDNPVRWRRIATDQASMSYGMAGDLAKSRSLNEAAITRDPDYPLYYYNLACADAESGDATAAQTHLQQAFKRRQNVLPGEKIPNPTTDDSILKLKRDKAFWAFVQTLPAN